MKTVLTILTISIAFFCNSCQAQSEGWSPLDIRKSEEGAEHELENAAEGDVVVFEYGSPAYTFYNFAYHHSFSGDLKAYHATYGEVGGFEKGFYYWKDDTTIAVKMTYPDADSTAVFELFGNGKSSGISIPD